MRIGNILVGEKPIKLAECGLNHNGDLDTAYRMIGVAKKSGADIVKFQTFKADEFCKPDDPLYPVFKKCELPDDAWASIAYQCEQVGIMFMSTPQNPSDLELLLPLGIPAIKIGSDDCANVPLVKEYASHGLPLIISTGMATQEQVRVTMNNLPTGQAVWLVCTSLYPTPPEEARVSRIESFKWNMNNLLVGFSDHTVGTNAAVMAVAYGATVFEKHFTLDHEMDGPDHAWACEPDELEQWCTAIDNAWVLRGDPTLELTVAEEEQRKKYQRRPGELLRGD